MKLSIRFWLLLLFVGAFFVNNHVMEADIMEARNLITAREMVEYDNWLTPTLNGGLRIEKPPLPTWIAGLIELVSPDNLPLQRVATGLMGIMLVSFMIMLVVAITRNRRVGVLAAIVAITCYSVILQSRTATWDIYCHAFMMAAIYFIYQGMYADRYRDASSSLRRRWFVGAGIMMGLSFLSKGPVSFYALLLPFLISCGINYRNSFRGKKRDILLMIVIALTIGSWWYLHTVIFHPDMAQEVYSKESGAWLNHNVRPWYYYWRYFLETDVWTIMAIAVMAVPVWKKRMRRKKAYLMVVTWTILSLLLLSFMPEKKTRYLLPMLLPLSMTIGMVLAHISYNIKTDKLCRVLHRIHGYVVSTLVIILPFLVFVIGYKKDIITLPMAIFLSIVFLIIGVWMYWCTAKDKVVQLVKAVALLFLYIELFGMGVLTSAFKNPEYHSIAETSKMETLKTMPFYSYVKEETRPELVYQARKRILPADVTDTATIRKLTPCVFVTRKPLSDYLKGDELGSFRIKQIGVYDDNRHPSNDKHYNLDFHNYVTYVE